MSSRTEFILKVERMDRTVDFSYLKNKDLKTSIFSRAFFGLPVLIQTAPLDKEGGSQFLFGDGEKLLLLLCQGLKELIVVRGFR
jgi:hypothetical protein